MKELLPRQTEDEFHQIFLEAFRKTKLKHARKKTNNIRKVPAPGRN